MNSFGANAVKLSSFDNNLLIDAFHDRELVSIKGRKFLINPLTEQIPATSAALLREAAQQVVAAGSFPANCKIVGEEDKGGILVAAVSLMTNLPFGLARWYPSGLDGQISVSFECEYVTGTLFLNGVEAGDQVVIVDDLVSTGGTMISLIRSIQAAGAHIKEIICVAEKIEYGGCARIKIETGIDVKCLLQVSVAGERSRVILPNMPASKRT